MKQHIIYGDTDSVYLHLENYAKNHDIQLDVDTAVLIADSLQAELQERLASVIGQRFVTPAEYIKILEPGREVVGRRGLFKDKKKRYAIHIVDNEGKKSDKLKIMGMETQRSDTPKFIQAFLKRCLEKVVKEDITFDDLRDYVAEFRREFREMDPWRRGSPGRVKNLGKFTKAIESYRNAIASGTGAGIKLPQMHFTVKAAINTNFLMEMNGEHRWAELRDGDKVEVLYLKDNLDGIDAVAIATGQSYVPDWFKELPFDDKRMEEKLLDKKLFNVLGDIMGWDFTPPKNFAAEVIKAMDDFYD